MPFWLLFKRKEALAAEGVPPEQVPTVEASAKDVSAEEASEGGES